MSVSALSVSKSDLISVFSGCMSRLDEVLVICLPMSQVCPSVQQTGVMGPCFSSLKNDLMSVFSGCISRLGFGYSLPMSQVCQSVQQIEVMGLCFSSSKNDLISVFSRCMSRLDEVLVIRCP